jgi:hypothetical protein
MTRLALKELIAAMSLTALLGSPIMIVAARAQGAPGGLPDLVGALKATAGCVGVETARTSSGKLVIFAWFENKKAVLDWYYSEAHQAYMKHFFPGPRPARTPLADVPDDGSPVLAVASITYADKAPSSITTLPISQIAIELYRPLPGGLALGGRFSPSALKVPALIDVPLPSAAPENK